MFKRIILHWTAGNYYPCPTDLKAYHFIIDKDGKVHQGYYTPHDNENCNDGKYAKHCGGGNTGAIGIAICCMKDPSTPPIRQQIEAMCKQAAQCCIQYGLKPSQVQTHAEFGAEHPKTSSYGKIDITILPYEHLNGLKTCGDYLRGKILWYYNKLKGI